MATAKMLFPLSIATPLSDELETNIFFPSCPVLVDGRELLVDLVLLDVIDFDVILGIELLAQHYASLDCHEKVMILESLMMKSFGSEVTRV